MMKRFYLIFFVCALACVTRAQSVVSGIVRDGAMNGEPAIGASVLVVGTSVGTITDMDGHFSLEVPDGKFILQVSMVGYKTQVVNIKGKTSVELTLLEDAQVMDEVVVVGYGTMKKRDLSGSVSQIKSEDLMQGGPPDVAMGMQAKTAGIDLKTTDAAPGGPASIPIRGAN